ncbi:MAG: hypothetical protein ACLFTA_03705 [Candidatus Nanohaloarchaea archaeon]
MIVLAVDEEAYREAWNEYVEDISREIFLSQSEEFYQELLRANIENTDVLSDIPGGLKDDLAEMAASVYTDQIERVMNSKYVGHEYEMAAATAFLEREKQVNVGAQAQGIVDANWEQISEQVQYNREQYRKWVAETLINPWPPSHFEMEHGDRFKPPEDDRTFQ